VKNAAGLEKTFSGNTFTVNNTQERVLVGDQGPYTMFADRLTGWWSYIGQEEITGYRYRVIGPDSQFITGWRTTDKTQETVSGLQLESGKEYRFEVQAVFSAGVFSNSAFSPGVVVDNTLPEISELVTPAYSTSSSLQVKWDGVDPESGIKRVEAALGTNYYETDVTKGWVEVTGNPFGLFCDANGEKLNLLTGERYYLTLRLINGAGLAVEKAAAGIKIDDTPPPKPVVVDQGAFINTRQPLEANWIWTPVDPESGTVKYEWAKFEFGEDISGVIWYDGDDTKKVCPADCSQEHGKTYYFAVKATNGAGLTSIGISDGIMVDATAPFIPRVKLLNAVNLGDPEADEINYITSIKELGLWIESTDPESDIAKYLYAWGNREEVDQQRGLESTTGLIELENPELSDREITVFSGRCINNAGESSATGYSSGVIVDASAPRVVNVKGCASGNELIFDWEVEPSLSPVVRYEVTLVTEEMMDTIPEIWTDVGLNQSYRLEAGGLADGRYRLLVRAYNAAGTCSRREGDIDEYGVSPSVTLDRTPPEIIESDFKYNRYVSSHISVQVKAEDNLSGINGYQYALGGRVNPFEFSGGWVDIWESNGYVEFDIDTQNIPHRTELYLMVRVKDNVGLWSEASVTEKILVDHTPPVTPEVTCGDYTTSKALIEGIVFNSDDPESGVTHCLISIVTEPGGLWLTTPEPLLWNEFTGRLSGLVLEEAGRYYVTVKTKNSAGLWSEAGYSGPVTVDTIPPELVFTHGDSEIVLNRPPVDVEYTLTEDADIEFILTAGEGTGRRFTMTAGAGTNHFTFNEGMPDTYILTAKPTDAAGNRGKEKSQTIRVNAPPEIYLAGEITTTPGKPVQLSANVPDADDDGNSWDAVKFSAQVVDPDGYPVEYRWDPGDGGSPLSGEKTEYRYTELGDYTLRLTVTDNDGGTTTAAVTVKVRNTTRGRLFMDEVWNGAHRLYGDVTVPEGIKLTVMPGTSIIVDGIPGDTGYDNALIVQGALDIPGESGGVTFSSVTEQPGGWKGIYIEGQADLSGLTVLHAVRGLTVINNADVTVTNCVLRSNTVGIHCYGSTPEIINTSFLSNTWYGIKEDEGGRPVVIECFFADNGIDYYHEELTSITVDRLNEISGNHGNHK